jgi:hypothetical protein
VTIFETTRNKKDGPSLDPDNCKAKPLKLDLRSTATSEWNKRCTEIFVKAYMALKGRNLTKDTVKKAFVTHMRALKKQHTQITQAELSGEVKDQLIAQEIRSEKYGRTVEVRVFRSLFSGS